MAKIKDFFDPHDWKFAIVGGVAAIALFAAVASLFWLASVSSERQQDNVNRDLFACQRGNVLRQQIIDLSRGNSEVHKADEQLLQDVIDITFNANPNRTPEQQAAVDALLDQLDAPFENFEARLQVYLDLVESIQLVDCNAVVEAGPTTTIKEEAGL